MKIAYLLDSTSCLSKDDSLNECDSLYYLPINIMLDGNCFLTATNLDIHQDKLYQTLIKSKDLKVILPTRVEVDNLLKKIIADGYDVLVTCLVGSALSNLQNIVYKQGLDHKITIIQLESKDVGMSQIAAIKMFKEQVKSGRSLLEIQNSVQHMLNVSSTYFIINDLNGFNNTNAHRINPNIIKNILDVKEVVCFDKSNNGKISLIGKVRSIKKAIETMVDKSIENIDVDEYTFYIGHYGIIKNAMLCEEVLLEKAGNVEFKHFALNDSVGIHTGTDTVSLSLIRKERN